jgi:hypothetical protein
MTDGHQQRRALTAAEQALQALQSGDSERARQAAARAAELDQTGIYSRFPDAVGIAADEIDASGAVSRSAWERLSVTLGPGPLQAIADLEAQGPA